MKNISRSSYGFLCPISYREINRRLTMARNKRSRYSDEDVEQKLKEGVDSVSTGETDSDSYLLGGSPLAQWTQIDKQTDVSSVQVDTTGYNQVRVIGYVGTQDTLTLTIDNLTDTSYQYTMVEGTSLVEVTGQSSFALTGGGDNMASGFDYTLTNTSGKDKTGIYGNAAAKFSAFDTLLRGAYDGSSSSLDSVELSQTDIQLIEVWGRKE
jgi:hypothetical protein